MSGGKHDNMKTTLSVDFTTVCGPMRKGAPCAYCYVNNKRCGSGAMKKRIVMHEGYDGWVLRLRQPMVDTLNKDGGLRLFGSGDYLPDQRVDMKALLDDCVERGIQCRALTKSTVFVRHFVDHPAVRVINLGIDALAPELGRSPVSWELARKYRDEYEKVLVRAVAVNMADALLFGGKEWVDIITLYHGPKTIYGFHHFTEEEYQQLCEQFGSERICATYVKCPDCDSKCGFPEQISTPRPLARQRPRK
jgi:hypothetical protein